MAGNLACLLTGKYNWRTFSGISSAFATPDIPSGDVTLAELSSLSTKIPVTVTVTGTVTVSVR